MSKMSKEAALAFFTTLYHGAHHIPGDIKPCGDGWYVNTHPSQFATFDFNGLTRLVFLAHDHCVRASVDKSGPGLIKICIWQRDKRTGGMMERHPTLATAVADWRVQYPSPPP